MEFSNLPPRTRFGIAAIGILVIAFLLIWLSLLFEMTGLGLTFRFITIIVAFIFIGVIWDRIFLHEQVI
jgi:hypothetical protein